ncbi:DUF6268 family outer membrane beta-barrel protein [Gramella lutea]|uniref:DUF6268 family outer membrane beta-barrel protein n=2 Tax=Christiangramia lutea TaxID=1607951 RepID=A0A9X1V007_9FLAO|nr:DUF6268 family outer membrane beta-barrel protein [Christiangramia lutea]MCH4821628.1 DUF6268 family outer membrane beta-barrel protein [Christiangramia lutea]
MRKILLLLLILFFCEAGIAQQTDLARIEYTYFPQKNSDNSFRRARAIAAFPIRMKKEGTYLVPSLEYRNVNFKYNDPEVFDTSDLDRFQSFTATLGYTFKIGEYWRFGAETGVKIASNFSKGDIISDDLIYTGTVIFIRRKEDPVNDDATRWILGLRYSTTAGFPFPLPIVNYYKRWDEKWSFAVGTPKSNLKYYFNSRHEVQAFVTLDGFFANIQENFDATPSNTGNDNIAENISMTIVLSGLGYEFSLTDHLKFYIYGGHTIRNDIRLRDSNQDDVYTINETNTFYGRSGLKFTIF